MPTSETLHTIFNGALDIVSELPATSVAQDRKEVRWLVRNYTPYVQASLRANPWNFAIEYHTLNRSASDPDFRWSYSHDLPNGWLRVLEPTQYGYRTGAPIPYEVAGNAVFSDWSGDFYARLVMDRQDPGDWDPLFAALIKARLAAGMAHSLTHKRAFIDSAKQAVAEALDVAETVNAFEGSAEPTEQHDIERVRYISR